MNETAKPLFDPVFSVSSTLTDHAARSSVLIFIAKVTRYCFVFLVQLILMNFLQPSDYGLLRYVTMVIGVISLINELGLSFAVVQKKSLEGTELVSAFSLNAMLGMALYCVTFASAPVIAAYFGNAQLTLLIRVGGAAAFLGAVSVVHRAILQRQFRYGRLAFIEITGALCGAVTAIACALKGLGVWSLVLSMSVNNVVSSLLLMTTVPWPKGSITNWAAAKNLCFFGAGVVVQRVLDYCAQNFHYLVIGKAFGEKTLGIFSVAYVIVTLPQYALGVVTGNVLMSAFSRIQEENERISNAFLRITAVTSVIAVPYFVLIFSFPNEMMHAVTFINQNDKWLPAADPIRILALLGLLSSLTSTPGLLWLSKGKVGLRIGWSIAMLATIILAVLAGRPFGVTGICFALVVRSVLFFPVTLIITESVVGLAPSAFISTILPSVICGGLMLTATLPLSTFVPGDSFARDIATLASGGVLGLGLYYLMLWLFFKKTFGGLLTMAASLRDGAGSFIDNR
jgi:O-antigen/teichoic acid export membrane protein